MCAYVCVLVRGWLVMTVRVCVRARKLRILSLWLVAVLLLFDQIRRLQGSRAVGEYFAKPI